VLERQDSIFNTHRYSFHSYKEIQVWYKNDAKLTRLDELETRFRYDHYTLLMIQLTVHFVNDLSKQLLLGGKISHAHNERRHLSLSRVIQLHCWIIKSRGHVSTIIRIIINAMQFAGVMELFNLHVESSLTRIPIWDKAIKHLENACTTYIFIYSFEQGTNFQIINKGKFPQITWTVSFQRLQPSRLRQSSTIIFSLFYGSLQHHQYIQWVHYLRNNGKWRKGHVTKKFQNHNDPV
jgi:hypothetical protein